MTEFSNEKNDASEAAAATSAATVLPDAQAGSQPQPTNLPILDEMALCAGAADWIEAVQRIEHRDWSAILRIASDGFDDIVGTIARFVQVEGSSSAGAEDVPQTASIADHLTSPMRAGSTGMAWYMPSNMDALLAGVQVQSKMTALDLGMAFSPLRTGDIIGGYTASGRSQIAYGQFETLTDTRPVVSAEVESPSPGITPVAEQQPSEPVTVGASDPLLTDDIVTEKIPAIDIAPAPQPELPMHSDLFTFKPGMGHVYVTDFDKGVDQILVTSDSFSSLAEMLAHSVAYQDEGSTVIEFRNGTDVLVLTHFSVEQLSADMFTFEPQTVAAHETQMIEGTDGNDVIDLGSGDHIVDAGAGFDVITGGSGSDTFVFGVNSGHDFIVDFKPHDDHIRIEAGLADSFDHLLDHAALYQDGGSTQIEFAGGQLITLYNTSAASVTADWFVFA